MIKYLMFIPPDETHSEPKYVMDVFLDEGRIEWISDRDAAREFTEHEIDLYRDGVTRIAGRAYWNSYVKIRLELA